MAVTETVLGAAGDVLEVGGASGAGGAATLTLGGPVELAHLRARVAAGGALAVLLVVGALAASVAQSVGALATFTGSCGTLGHLAETTHNETTTKPLKRPETLPHSFSYR